MYFPYVCRCVEIRVWNCTHSLSIHTQVSVEGGGRVSIWWIDCANDRYCDEGSLHRRHAVFGLEREKTSITRLVKKQFTVLGRSEKERQRTNQPWTDSWKPFTTDVWWNRTCQGFGFELSVHSYYRVISRETKVPLLEGECRWSIPFSSDSSSSSSFLPLSSSNIWKVLVHFVCKSFLIFFVGVTNKSFPHSLLHISKEVA